MSEFLDFNQEVGEECDETTEEDLNYLKDPCLNLDLIVTPSPSYLLGHAEAIL